MGNKNYSKGITWIDDCRIPFVDGDTTSAGKRTCNIFETEYKSGGNGSPDYITDSRGRFPANILVCDDMLNDGIKPNKGHRAKSKVTGYGEFGGGKNEYHGIGEYMEVDSKSRYYDIDKWFNNLIDG
jgi:hypothetical protein